MKRLVLNPCWFITLLVTCVANAGEEPLQEQIIWNRFAPDQALFLPELVLQRKSLDDLPIGESARRSLVSRINSAQAEADRQKACAEGATEACGPELPVEEQVARETSKVLAEQPHRTEEEREGIRRMVERSVLHERAMYEKYPRNCTYVISAHPDQIESLSMDFAQHFTERRAVFSAKVFETVAGWNTQRSREVTMVYVEVEEIFKDHSVVIWPGKIVAFDQISGRLSVQGATLCTVPQTTYTLLSAGDRVLVFGDQFDAGETLVSQASVFPIVESMIQPQPLASDKSQMPVSLEEFTALTKALKEDGR